MILLEYFTILPFTLSVLAFSLSIVSVLFYYYMYKRLIDIKYLLRFFLIISIAVYFLFETLYFIFFVYNSATKTHIYFYIIKEIVFLYVILIFFICMKEITYKNFIDSITLDYISKVAFILSFVIIILAFFNPNSFVKLTTSYLNVYQNRVNIYGIGNMFIAKDIIVAFIMIFNTIVLGYIIIFTKGRLKYNIITFFSIFVLTLAFIDDSYALYFSYYKSNPNFNLSRISLGLFLFLIGLLTTSILRILDNLKKIDEEKEILSSKLLLENKFIKDISVLLNETIEIKNTLSNTSMLLINISKSSREYISSLEKKLGLSYEDSKNLVQYEYSKQSSSTYNEYTFTKLSKSFQNFNQTIDRSKESIHRITDIIISLMDKTSSIINISNGMLKNIDNYSTISKDKTDTILMHFKKHSSFNQLSRLGKRAHASMKNMSERISTLSVNSGIQASKSGEYSETFSHISKEIALLANDTTQASEKFDYILSTVSEIFKNFSNAKNSILEDITNLNNYVGSINLSVERIPELIISENDKNETIIDNNKALDTLIENIVFLLKDEIENCNKIKEEITAIIANFYKIDLEFNLYRKKIHSSIYDINKIENTLSELNILAVEFDGQMRNISELLDTLLMK